MEFCLHVFFFPVMECEIRAFGRNGNASYYRVEGSGGYIGGEHCRIVSKVIGTTLLSCHIEMMEEKALFLFQVTAKDIFWLTKLNSLLSCTFA